MDEGGSVCVDGGAWGERVDRTKGHRGGAGAGLSLSLTRAQAATRHCNAHLRPVPVAPLPALHLARASGAKAPHPLSRPLFRTSVSQTAHRRLSGSLSRAFRARSCLAS